MNTEALKKKVLKLLGRMDYEEDITRICAFIILACIVAFVPNLLISSIALGLGLVYTWDEFNPAMCVTWLILGICFMLSLISYICSGLYEDFSIYVKLENQHVEQIHNQTNDEDGTWYKVTSDNYPDCYIQDGIYLNEEGKYVKGMEIFKMSSQDTNEGLDKMINDINKGE